MRQLAFNMTLNGRWVVSIDLDSRLNAAFAKQLERLAEAPNAALALRRLTCSVVAAIERSLDADLKAPTAAQLRLATIIAQDLNLSLPADVLRFRGEAKAFIDVAVSDTEALAAAKAQLHERA